jgi:hypothetical protein
LLVPCASLSSLRHLKNGISPVAARTRHISVDRLFRHSSAFVHMFFSRDTTYRFQDVDASSGSDIDIPIHVQALMHHITSGLGARTNLLHLHLHLC